MALALVVQFYSNYIIAAANLPALFFLVWLMRGQGWRAVRRVAAVTGCLGVVALLLGPILIPAAMLRWGAKH